MAGTLLIQGRTVSEVELSELRGLVARSPDASRYRLSRELCALWDWRDARGRPKDMAARTLMLKLERRGLLTLPPARRRQPVRASRRQPEIPADGIEGVLSNLRPLEWTVVGPAHHARHQWEAFLEHHHYLGFRGHVGENLAYLVRDRGGRALACMLFGAAAWKCQPRDQWIGWHAEAREQRLSYLTAQTRFLILPWVRVPHLASHLLGRVVRRLARDWVEKYGHPVYVVETFVDRDRFAGTCYQAANWARLGSTQGRGRQDRHTRRNKPVKDIYAYPLTRHFRERLGS